MMRWPHILADFYVFPFLSHTDLWERAALEEGFSGKYETRAGVNRPDSDAYTFSIIIPLF